MSFTYDTRSMTTVSNYHPPPKKKGVQGERRWKINGFLVSATEEIEWSAARSTRSYLVQTAGTHRRPRQPVAPSWVRQITPTVLKFSPVSIIPPLLHNFDRNIKLPRELNWIIASGEDCCSKQNRQMPKIYVGRNNSAFTAVTIYALRPNERGSFADRNRTWSICHYTYTASEDKLVFYRVVSSSYFAG